MSYFTIAGHSNCVHFAHAVYAATYLNEKLPSFKFRKVEIDENNWTEYLLFINERYGWCVIRSPIIWKQLTRYSGQTYLIGGLGEFWEHCLDYYGLVSSIPKDALEKIIADRKEADERQKENVDKQTVIVGVLGAGNFMTNLLLYDIKKALNMRPADVLKIYLFDDNEELDPDDYTEIVNVVDTIQEVVEEVDLLFVFTDYRRRPDEKDEHWLMRCFIAIRQLSDEINVFAKSSLRIIVSHWGPVCFTATVLVKFCTIMSSANIIAITADHGISLLPILSQMVSVPIDQMGSPPVWGSPDLSLFIDHQHTIFLADVIRPMQRSSRANWAKSTLPLAKVRYELRQMVNSLDDISYDSQIRKQTIEQIFSRPSLLPKYTATVNILTAWYANEISNYIFSLGVCSNGTFGFRKGVVLSQPVYLNSNRIWEPCVEFPLDTDQMENISKTVNEINDLVKPIYNSDNEHSFINDTHILL